MTRTIRHAITYLATPLPELAAHLNEALVTAALSERRTRQPGILGT